MANQDHDGRRLAGDDPLARIDRFRKARTLDPQCDLGDFLPPPGAGDRFAVLVELIKLDLEHRAKAGQPTRLEPYLRRFAADLPAAAVPVSLLYEEYRVRHRFADAPPVGEYRARFPARYDEFRQYVDRHPLNPPSAGPDVGTVFPSAGGTRDADVTKSTGVPSAPPSGRPPAPAPPPPAAQSKGPPPADSEYKTLKLIGKGAYGKVFLGEAPGGVPVAIKQILRGIDHPVGRSEWDALAAIKKLSHPFLIQVHTFWVDQDQLYIVTELAEKSLDDRIKECKEQGLPGVPVEELLPYFAQAAEALDYLHAHKVTHRDVKPQNLLILRGYAKVADFGLARAHAHQLTNVAHSCGTPLFMAPEVWRKKVAYQSDQYSLAATYVMARLVRPLFESEFMDQLIVKHLEATPDLAPLPAAEQRVLLKALAKKPEDRFPSCKAFTDALREAVAPPPPPPSPWPRRAIVGGAVAVGCGLAYLLFMLFAGPPPPPPPPPEVDWKPAGWEPAADAAVKTDVGGKKFFDKVERPVGDVTLTAVLVPHARPTDKAASFYLLRDKVTNRVFRAVWGEAGPAEALARFRPGRWGQGAGPLPGRWKDGASVPGKPDLGTAGDRLDLPVVKVTAVEAALAAFALGGHLPTFDHWAQAVGLDDGPDAGPPFDPAKVALRKDRPQPVTPATADLTPDGVHQLLSNGLEWTRTTRARREFSPFADPPTDDLLVTGADWYATSPPSFKELRGGGRRRQYPWHNTDEQIGFRVVLEQPR
jgi:hypothetical protein